MANYETQGSDFSQADLSKSGSFTEINTKGTTGENNIPWSWVPNFVGKLEERFAFSATIIALIGYIVIASFGEMKTFGQYFGYIFFLILIYLFYFFVNKQFTKSAVITALAIIVFSQAVFLIFTYQTSIYNLFNKFISTTPISQEIVEMTSDENLSLPALTE